MEADSSVRATRILAPRDAAPQQKPCQTAGDCFDGTPCEGDSLPWQWFGLFASPVQPGGVPAAAGSRPIDA